MKSCVLVFSNTTSASRVHGHTLVFGCLCRDCKISLHPGQCFNWFADLLKFDVEPALMIFEKPLILLFRIQILGKGFYF
jgi:hypothetical protein